MIVEVRGKQILFTPEMINEHLRIGDTKISTSNHRLVSGCIRND